MPTLKQLSMATIVEMSPNTLFTSLHPPSSFTQHYLSMLSVPGSACTARGRDQERRHQVQMELWGGGGLQWLGWEGLSGARYIAHFVC